MKKNGLFALCMFLFIVISAALPSKWESMCDEGSDANMQKITKSLESQLNKLESGSRTLEQTNAFVDDLFALFLRPVSYVAQKTNPFYNKYKGRFSRAFCFMPHRQFLESLVKRSGTFLSNAIAFSRHRTSDRVISLLHAELLHRFSSGVPQTNTPVADELIVPLIHSLLVLTSARNELLQRHHALLSFVVYFQYTPLLSNYWFGSLLQLYQIGPSEKTTLSNLRFLMDKEEIRHRWNTFDERMTMIYYPVSYYHSTKDKLIKEHINNVLHMGSNENLWLNAPSPRCMKNPPPAAVPEAAQGKIRVAVITQFYFRRHSVYRTIARYVAALRATGRYYIELLYIGEFQYDSVQDGFDKVVRFDDPSHHSISMYILMYVRNGQHPPSQPWHRQKKSGSLADVDLAQDSYFRFDIVYFPDVGMSWASAFLANKRLAPITVASPGHSTSSHGAYIDYFISGDQVELLPEVENGRIVREPADFYYSETLVLLPGAGVIHNHPFVSPSPLAPLPLAAAPLIINCPSTAQKINNDYLQTVRLILQRATRPVELRFISNLDSPFSVALFERSVSEALGLQVALAADEDEGGFEKPDIPPAENGDPNRLGHRVVGYSFMDYPKFMSFLATGHLFIEPFHYGGCNSVVDSLFLGTPIVLHRGRRWYNRIGTHIFQQALFGPRKHTGSSLNDQQQEEALELSEMLLASNSQEYVEKVVALINQPSKLERARQLIAQLDLSRSIFQDVASYHLYFPPPSYTNASSHQLTSMTQSSFPHLSEPEYFPVALDYLIELHRTSESSGTSATRLLSPLADSFRKKLQPIRLREVLSGFAKTAKPPFSFKISLEAIFLSKSDYEREHLEETETLLQPPIQPDPAIPRADQRKEEL